MKKHYERFIKVIGGKEYSKGNHCWVHNKLIIIEFDSDYYITKKINAKTEWFEMAIKIINKIPDPVTIDWFIKNDFIVPKEIQLNLL